MDNKNFYNNSMPNGFYPYGYSNAATPGIMRQELPAYMMSQAAVPAVLKGRPVSSFEEARVPQIDLDGSLSIFPDLGNKKIYTKRINLDGTASLNTYSLDEHSIDINNTDYATKAEIAELKATLDTLIENLKVKQKNITTPINL